MSDDHLSNEISISAELTETGVKASAKSRTISSMDRLLGGAFDAGSAWLEGVAMRRRAKNEGERQLIEAAVKFGLDKMNIDDQFAQRAFGGHFAKVARQQLNKDAVVAEALEDLRRTPPTEEEAVNGPSSVSEEFMGSFERYAETASSEELRQRWGRILSAEIRRPGTFGAKVLRITDEIEASTAALFERLAASRLRNDIVPISISQDLLFAEKVALVTAGLILDPGSSVHVTSFIDAKMGSGEEFWYLGGKSYGIGFMKSANIVYGDVDMLRLHKGAPAISTYIFTDAGRALCSILPSDERDVIRRMSSVVKRSVANDEVLFFSETDKGSISRLSPEYFA